MTPCPLCTSDVNKYSIAANVHFTMCSNIKCPYPFCDNDAFKASIDEPARKPKRRAQDSQGAENIKRTKITKTTITASPPIATTKHSEANLPVLSNNTTLTANPRATFSTPSASPSPLLNSTPDGIFGLDLALFEPSSQLPQKTKNSILEGVWTTPVTPPDQANLEMPKETLVENNLEHMLFGDLTDHERDKYFGTSSSELIVNFDL